MEEFLKALKARYDAAAGATLRGKLPGGYHCMRSPHDTEGACLVVTLPGGTVEGSMTDDYDMQTVQFSLFFPDPEQLTECIQARDALIALYDDAYLTIGTSGGLTMGVWRSTPGTPVEDPDKGWACHTQYRYWYDDAA